MPRDRLANFGRPSARRNSVNLVRLRSLAAVTDGPLGAYWLELIVLERAERLLHLKLPSAELVSLRLAAPGCLREAVGLWWEWTGDEQALTLWPAITRPGAAWLVQLGRVTAMPRRHQFYSSVSRPLSQPLLQR